MKLLAVSLLVLAVGVEHGIAQLLDRLNPLDIHYMNNCGKGRNAKPIAAYMGPCYDTPSCRIPRCCGIVSGRDSLFRIVYEAAVPIKNGTFNGNLGGFGFGDAVEGCENNFLPLNLPFQVTVPPTSAGYSRKLWDQTRCPQRVGGVYTLDIPFRFVTTLMTTFDLIKADFVAQVFNECGEQALCWGLWATLVNADALDSLVKVVEEVASDPVGSLTNPFKTLQGPLVGLYGRKNVNPF